MENLVLILISIPVGIMTSLLFLLLIYNCSRPKINISDKIALHKNGTFAIKVINKTSFEVMNIRAKLYRVTVSNIPNGTLKTHIEVELEKNELFVLNKFENTILHEDYGWRFKTKEDLNSYLEKGEYLKFQIIAQNSYSNAIKVFEKRYDSQKHIMKGLHKYGVESNIE